jgi:putative DNA primase/helicase
MKTKPSASVAASRNAKKPNGIQRNQRSGFAGKAPETRQKAVKPQSVAEKPSAKKHFQFHMDEDNGLYIMEALGQPNFLVCPPFKIVGKLVDPDGGNPSYLLRHKNLVGNINKFELPFASLSNPQKAIQQLTAAGFEFPTGNPKARINAIGMYLEGYCDSKLTYVRVAQDGWKKLPDGEQQYIFCNEALGGTTSNYKAIRLPKARPTLNGTKVQWLALMKSLRHDPMAILVVCFAFAAVLLRPMGFNSVMLFLVGVSSIGKTILLKLAASVFASPDDVLTWEGTDNGIEANLLRHKDKPFIIDEVGQANARQFSSFSYRLTNASSKQRANVTGQAVEVQQSRSTILSAGEVAPLDVMQDAGINAKKGQSARLVSVPVAMRYGVWERLGKHATGAEKSLYVQNELANVYGGAGMLFCKAVVPKINEYRTRFAEVSKDLAHAIAPELPDEGDGVPGRVLQNFVLAAFAGLLAVEHKVVPWGKEEVLNAMRVAFGRWFDEYKARQPLNTEAPLAAIRLFLESQRSSKFKPLDTWGQNHEGTVAGFELRNRKGEEFFLVFKTYFEQNLCGKNPVKIVLQALHNAGYLKSDSRTTPTMMQVALPGAGGEKRSFYAIRKSILQG